MLFFFVKQKTAYEMRISDWSSDVCSSDLRSGRSRPWNYFRGKFTLFRTTLSRSSRDRSERAVTIPSLSADGIPLLPLWYGRPLPVPWYIHPAKAGGARSSRPAQRQRLPRPSGAHYQIWPYPPDRKSVG